MQADRKKKIRIASLAKKIVASMPGYAYWKDEHLVYRGCNRAFAFLVNLPDAEEVIGKNDHDFGFGESLTRRIVKNDFYVIGSRKQSSSIYKLPFKNKDGEYICVKASTAVFEIDNEMLGVIGVACDISKEIACYEKVNKKRNLLKILFITFPDLFTGKIKNLSMLVLIAMLFCFQD